jgi:hypothetical protein
MITAQEIDQEIRRNETWLQANRVLRFHTEDTMVPEPSGPGEYRAMVTKFVAQIEGEKDWAVELEVKIDFRLLEITPEEQRLAFVLAEISWQIDAARSAVCR